VPCTAVRFRGSDPQVGMVSATPFRGSGPQVARRSGPISGSGRRLSGVSSLMALSRLGPVTVSIRSRSWIDDDQAESGRTVVLDHVLV
jgi:hypothetical protein